jgi:hypothetical protein
MELVQKSVCNLFDWKHLQEKYLLFSYALEGNVRPNKAQLFPLKFARGTTQ